MTIKPGVGINVIKFGMSENQILDLIGKPTKIIIDEDDDDKNPVYLYNELKLRLTFYTEYNGKFGYIRVANPKLISTEIELSEFKSKTFSNHINRVKIIGMKKIISLSTHILMKRNGQL